MDRNTTVRVLYFWFMLAAVMSLFGCGGGSSVQGSVSGVVFDIDGNPVRGASVYTGDKYSAQTTSNSNGTYILNTVQGEFATVKATLTVNGVPYYGQNLLQVFNGEQTKSINITIVKKDSLAQITGSIIDRGGNIVSGAQVFAISPKGLSSSNAISDNQGNYRLTGLLPGIQYSLAASSAGFNQDQTVASLNSGETRTIDFSLNDPTNTAVAAPKNFLATAFTSPAEATRSLDGAHAVENIKRLLDPKRATRHFAAAKTRTTPAGNLTEVDLTWDPVTDPGLLGFGVYRSVGTGTPSSVVDYVRDPLSTFYADLDASLLVGGQYTYAVTSLNANFGGPGGTQSFQTPSSTVTVLGDLTLNGVDASSVTFAWNPATGATVYAVYLFDQYPNIGVTSIWNNDLAGQQSTGTSQRYTGAGALISGKTYYYIVIGRNANGSGVTISRVGQFVKA